MKIHAECPGCGAMVRTLVIAVNPTKLKNSPTSIMCQDCASKEPGVKFQVLQGLVTI